MMKVRMKGFMETMEVDRALAQFFEALPPFKRRHQFVPVNKAINRVLADDIVSEVDIPAFDKAAMDGFAVVASDTFGASQTSPVALRVLGEVAMGAPSRFNVGKGEAVAVTTGGPMPSGTDAVVMLEHTKKVGEVEVEVCIAVTPGDNVSRAGEDVAKGDVVLRKGMVLKPQDVGILAALGLSHVKVVVKPRVAVLSTGSELVEPGTPLQSGKTVNVNNLILSMMVAELGGVSVNLGTAGDNLDEIKDRISEGLVKADVVVITGGTSVGKTDLVPEAVNTIGKPGMIVHGVSMRPGKPTGLAVIDGIPVVSLSGYPVAAMMGFNTFVRPLILKMLGTVGEPMPRVRAELIRRVASTAGVRVFLRVKVKKCVGRHVAEPLRSTGSGILSSMVQANGIVVIPEAREGFEAGEEVEVLLFRPVEEEGDG